MSSGIDPPSTSKSHLGASSTAFAPNVPLSGAMSNSSLLLVLAAPLLQSAVEASAAPRAPQLDPERIRPHLQFLAHDLLEGRAPGTRGGDLAAEYLATQAKILGLQPSGDDGGWYQAVPLVGIETKVGSTLRFDAPNAKGPALRLLEDFVATDETLAAATSIDAPVVFAGYGIVSPENGWDDYAGVDVAGKVVLLLANEPGRDDPTLFGGPALTYSGRWTYKYEEAARQGAVGAILVHTDESAGYGWSVVRNSWGRERPYPPPAEGALRMAAWVQQAAAREALGRVGMDLDDLIARAEKRGFRAVRTALVASARLEANTRAIETKNVLALAPGADLERAMDVIVFTAHYDHLGVATPENGDAIYNGAVDNASGCATLLEIARLWTALPERPPRTALFAWVTAEEGGLRGSQHYARNPTVPPGRIVANVNVDGLPLVGEPAEIAPLGYDRSTLRSDVERAAAALDLGVVPDRHPEQGYFFRSDHFSFAKIGVPAISVNAGRLYRGEAEDAGERREAEYRKLRYHRPADHYEAGFDLRPPAVIGRFCLEVALDLAHRRDLPAYLPGDEFARAQPDRKP